MTRQKLVSSRRLGLESLENRLLMAGNVSVSVSSGDLVVTGDSQANELQIVQSVQNGVPIPGRYFISGQNGTTINGQAAGQFFGNVTDDIRVILNGGADRLTMGDDINGHFIVPDDLEISTGDGNDAVTLRRLTVRDDATILTGNGSDSVFARTTVGSLAGVDGGNNNLAVDTGAGLDRVLLWNTFVRHNLNINTGIDSGADYVDLYFMNIGNDTSISTGGGSDTVRATDVGFNDDLIINTGAGNDLVLLNRCQVDELFANLGADNDRLELRYSSGRRASLNGETGVDTLVRINSPFSESFQSNSF